MASALADRRLVGRTYGGWRLDAVLGQGRFGTCYRASRARGASGSGPEVAALKLFAADAETSDEVLWAEAKALSLCAHDAVPRWLGIVREREDPDDRGLRFMAQSLMPGTSLDRLLFRQGRTFDLDAVARIAAQLTSALAHLHARGIAHNDVRPANVLLAGDGRVSLVDFGLATFFERSVGEAAASPADRNGLADVVLFLLYACPDLPRASEHAGNRAMAWYDDLDLSDGQRTLLLDLFSDEPALRDWAAIGAAFDEAFSR